METIPLSPSEQVWRTPHSASIIVGDTVIKSTDT